ncbi:guanine nucleotide-binding protein subunit gamma 3-like [Olea europaea var. sylvestris]|uniref:guanine nucleotide-binding protein subunit gamma 3-like n=1 Tax=Olea europaea var. sylvestris TaxID=158386 RepID=UPI000C1D4F4E|nr:guanine nucleotide-binding protein subunit gamma 3-like [Olea europaea var. sylvestris]
MGDSVGTGTVPPLPPPLPKSPPQYPDLYGKRRELAKVQILEREISFLEEELRSVEGLLPASRSCKEIADFVTGKSDPLIPITKKVRRSYRFWKWLCGISCFNLSLICCCPKCPHLHMPHCCKCNLCNLDSCISCPMPKYHCSSSCLNTQCCKMSDCSCRRRCCIPKCPTCSVCFCCIPKCPTCSVCFCFARRCTCCYPKCPKVNICSCCDKSCCYSCYLCC